VVLAEKATLCVPGFVDAQRVSAVPAGIDESAEFVVFPSDDDERLVLDVVFLPVAGLRQVLGAADDLPHAHPDRFPLPLRVFA
jgi:hypothetical protein